MALNCTCHRQFKKAKAANEKAKAAKAATEIVKTNK